MTSSCVAPQRRRGGLIAWGAAVVAGAGVLAGCSAAEPQAGAPLPVPSDLPSLPVPATAVPTASTTALPGAPVVDIGAAVTSRPSAQPMTTYREPSAPPPPLPTEPGAPDPSMSAPPESTTSTTSTATTPTTAPSTSKPTSKPATDGGAPPSSPSSPSSPTKSPTSGATNPSPATATSQFVAPTVIGVRSLGCDPIVGTDAFTHRYQVTLSGGKNWFYLQQKAPRAVVEVTENSFSRTVTRTSIAVAEGKGVGSGPGRLVSVAFGRPFTSTCS